MASLPLIQVIVGSTREGRFADHVLSWVRDRLESRPDLKTEVVDLRDFPLPFFDGPAPAKNVRQYTLPEVARLGETIDRADGFLVLTPEYNHGYPAVLKNALDWTFAEWSRKPITFVGWGNTGGARAIEQLREVAVEFEMAPLRFAVHVLADTIVRCKGSNDPSDPENFGPLDAALDRAVTDLLWWSDALRQARG